MQPNARTPASNTPDEGDEHDEIHYIDPPLTVIGYVRERLLPPKPLPPARFDFSNDAGNTPDQFNEDDEIPYIHPPFEVVGTIRVRYLRLQPLPPRKFDIDDKEEY